MDRPRDWHFLLDRNDAYGNSVIRPVAVTTASAIVLPANARRKRALFVNDSDAVIYLTRGSPAVLSSAIRLNAYGGSWEELPDTLGYYWRAEFSAITAAGSKTLMVMEDS